MIYNLLKILHIISATLLLTSIAYSFMMWRDRYSSARVGAIISSRIQTQTWVVIIPVALFQMASGFTMLSLQEDDLSQLWIVGSIVGFIVFIASWFSFIYFLLLAQQVPIDSDAHGSAGQRYKFFRRAQSFMLMICAGALLSMVFFMSNKVT
jgi:uncharacterized membrane protein